MELFGHDWSFWIALVGATLVRVLTSPFHSFFRSVVMVVTSVFVAWLFTDPVVDWMRLNPGVYAAPVGGLLALTADGIVRMIFKVSSDPGVAIDLWNRLRGREVGESVISEQENRSGDKEG